MRAQTRYARSGEVSIADQVNGEGPFDLVLVPPAGSHVKLAWEVPVLRRAMFERFGSFARAIHFDKRGTGVSDPVSEPPMLEPRIDDGCAVSVLVDASYPDRTWALVLYGGRARSLRAPDYPYGPAEAEALREIADLRTEGQARFWSRARSGTSWRVRGSSSATTDSPSSRASPASGEWRVALVSRLQWHADPSAPSSTGSAPGSARGGPMPGSPTSSR